MTVFILRAVARITGLDGFFFYGLSPALLDSMGARELTVMLLWPGVVVSPLLGLHKRVDISVSSDSYLINIAFGLSGCLVCRIMKSYQIVCAKAFLDYAGNADA